MKDIIAFYQPFSAEDVRYENGDLYVDAQLLFTTDDTLSYSDTEKLLSSYGGELVGYVSVTNDYQVSFSSQTTHEELNNLIQEIGAIDGIDEVTFNYVYEMDDTAIDYKQDPWIPASDPKNTSGSEWSEAEPKGTNWWAEAVRLPSV